MRLDKSKGYFKNQGVNVMAFDDIYPSGHQSGVSIIMHGKRVATNGDIRFEPTPGQWQPIPVQGERVLDENDNTIVTSLKYPDKVNHLDGFNPMIYPDFEFEYKVSVKAVESWVKVTVDIDREIPEKYIGKLCFNMELFPGELLGKPWIMDDKQGIFPPQPNGPITEYPSNYYNMGDYKTERNDKEAQDDFLVIQKLDVKADVKHLTGENKGYNPIIADDLIAKPYVTGKCFTVRPEDEHSRFTIQSVSGEVSLFDGRMNHNNGWFVVSEALKPGKTQAAIEWIIKPNIVDGWLHQPVVQVSQVGYHPDQKKCAVIELDANEKEELEVQLYKIGINGPELICSTKGKKWGSFLRYEYISFDFSDVSTEGLYQVKYGNSKSEIFRIAKDIYQRGVWQPVIEYFLPVQMCHMRVNEKYRVWHGLCHMDDAKMAPLNIRHFDGYAQGNSTLTKFKSGDHVPGLNAGGWHDAGDFDLRVESQSGEAYILSCIYEEFGTYYDATTIDQQNHVVEIHQPDGKNDILEQIEHGALTVVNGYKALGRLYRGIICNDLRQYVLLGDAVNMTDGKAGDDDDRWVFTENNPERELMTSAHLASISRALSTFNPSLSKDCKDIAIELFDKTDVLNDGKIISAVELYITTKDKKYREYILNHKDYVMSHLMNLGSSVVRVVELIDDESFSTELTKKLADLKKEIYKRCNETPYGVPYRPHIWGAGWGIQAFASQYYYLNKHYPDIFDEDIIYNALNFILGCHPGSNTSSFASGVGAKSMTTAYGMNRADWSYIPGGVVSGTALIRPDFPELLEFPYLWQQAEYVLGGGSSHYMFLVLAVIKLLG